MLKKLIYLSYFVHIFSINNAYTVG